MNRYVGYLLVTACLWSLGGLWIKFIDWNPVAIAGVRCLLAFVVIAAVKPKALCEVSWGALPGAIAYAAVMFLFVLATKLTTAANAVFLHYTAPVYIALLGPWFLGERTRPRDWLLIAVALVGIALFFCDQLSFQGICGVAAGLASGFSSAWLIMLMRRQRHGSPEAVTQLGNLLTFCVALPAMWPALHLASNAPWLVGLGAVSLGVPYLLYAKAIRHVKALDATLITVIEPILSPVWVMLALGERPSGLAMAGGSLVLGTSVLRSVLTARDAKANVPAQVASPESSLSAVQPRQLTLERNP
jgi:drug/metabolite transporter (DMT)-like permease